MTYDQALNLARAILEGIADQDDRQRTREALAALIAPEEIATQEPPLPA